MSLIEKTCMALGTGIFFGASLWLWADMGDAVFISRALAFVQSCL
jgi:hypothetical protein